MGLRPFLSGVPLNTRMKQKRVMLLFPHGLGDCCQFQIVLRHLRQAHPDWFIGVAAYPGREVLFRGLADKFFQLTIPKLWWHETWDEEIEIKFLRPQLVFNNCPNTKAADCLVNEFGIEPQGDLFYYEFKPSPEAHAKAEQFAALHAPYALIHPFSECTNLPKHLDEDEIEKLIAHCLSTGVKPVIVDFGWHYYKWWNRPELGWLHSWEGWLPEWRTPSADVMAAIIANARAMFGIDSGAEHLAATTKTPTIVIWKADGFHPINYFEPAGNVVHYIKAKGHQDISPDALSYFNAHYQSGNIHRGVRVHPGSVSEFHGPI